MAEPRETVPHRLAAPEVLGELFEKYAAQFMQTHRAQYEQFLRDEGLTPREMTRKKIDPKLLETEWTAAQMAYYLFRYGGTLGVHYQTLEHLEDLQLREGPVLRTEEFSGGKGKGRIGLLLNDLLAGRSFRSTETLADFSTWGDCDEIAFTIAQGLDALSRNRNLGLKIGLVRKGTHAVVGLEIPGVGKRLLDPTFGDQPSPRMYVSGIQVLVPGVLTKKDLRRYDEEMLPKLNRRIAADVQNARVSPRAIDRLEGAFQTAATLSHEELGLIREVNRRLWYADVREDDYYREELQQEVQKLRPSADKRTIQIATIGVATLFTNFEGALARLQRMQERKGLNNKEALALLNFLAERALKGKTEFNDALEQQAQAFMEKQKRQKIALR